MSNELAKLDVPQLMQLGSVFAKSGFFADARQEAQAVVKILAGAEMGFSPIASMMGVYVIQGRVSVGANLMAAAVKKSGKYDYRVLQMDESICEIEYFQEGKSIGKSVFTLQDAKKAGTKNLDKFARNMLFARAMSNGVRWYCPDALGGTPVYTPEEMGADTDEEGNVVGGVAVAVPDPQPVPDLIKPSAVETIETLGAQYYRAWGSKREGFIRWASERRTTDIMALTEDEGQHAIEWLRLELKARQVDVETVTAAVEA